MCIGVPAKRGQTQDTNGRAQPKTAVRKWLSVIRNVIREPVLDVVGEFALVTVLARFLALAARKTCMLSMKGEPPRGLLNCHLQYGLGMANRAM